MAEPTDSGRVSPAIDAEREALLKVLVDHDVQFVVIGGAGIQSHGRQIGGSVPGPDQDACARSGHCIVAQRRQVHCCDVCTGAVGALMR